MDKLFIKNLPFDYKIAWYEIKGKLYRAFGKAIEEKIAMDLYMIHGLGYFASGANIYEIILLNSKPIIIHLLAMDNEEKATELVELLK